MMIKMPKKNLLALTLTIFTMASTGHTSELQINQLLWQQFSVSDRSTILNKFPALELASPETIGVIQSVQTVNRSTAGSNTGAILGGALGQAAYVDHALKGSGNNYSAVNQIGAAVLGAAIGSTADQAPQSLFIFNYAIKTLDGQLREVRISSNQEFTKPIGQCVSFPELRPLQTISCSSDKIQLLKGLSSIAMDATPKTKPRPTAVVNVACRVPNIGLMTLERNICSEMEGKEE